MVIATSWHIFFRYALLILMSSYSVHVEKTSVSSSISLKWHKKDRKSKTNMFDEITLLVDYAVISN